MSHSPFPYTCELCGAEGLTDDGMRAHTLEAHINGRPECPFCDVAVPQPQLVGHVQRAHLHYLTPERELMAFIDDQSPGYDDDSKMTNTDSCSFYTPGSMNGWHSPDVASSGSYHNGAISKNINHPQNGYRDHQDGGSSSQITERDRHRDSHRKERDGEVSRSLKNINLMNGVKNINIGNGVIPKTKNTRSRESSCDGDHVNGHGHDKHGHASNSPSHNTSYEGSPNKKIAMAGGGQGSPLRSQLALKLKPNTPKKSAPTPSPTVQCLLCDFTSTCPRKLEEHINRAHFDLTSPSVIVDNANATVTLENPTLGTTNSTTGLTNATLALTNAMATIPVPGTSTYQCPICEINFASVSEVEIHVNVDHKDILSPQKPDSVDNASYDDVVMMEESPVSNCPVCCQPLPQDQDELMLHVESHFERSSDGAGAALTEAEREARRTKEQQEFQLLRAQYGMEEDDDEGYTEHATNSLKRAVYSGALSVAGYYEQSVSLKKSSTTHRDTGCSRTTGLLEKISQLNAQNQSILKTYLCSAVDHYASTYGDRGWGCGYRNMQMVLSSLIRCPSYSSLLDPWCERDGDIVPSIPRLQSLVERAWSKGFDTQGSEQLGCKLHNTRKWIGACEVVTVLSSLRIRCQLIDFHKPTGADGSHPALLDWVLRYFTQDPTGFKPPLYLQHQGHSRTVIGYERHRDGKATLLVLDPSHSPAQVRQLTCGPAPASVTALRLLRRASPALRARQYQLLVVTGVMTSDREYEVIWARAHGLLRARQYQLLVVTGVMTSDREYEASKVLQSVRIP